MILVSFEFFVQYLTGKECAALIIHKPNTLSFSGTKATNTFYIHMMWKYTFSACAMIYGKLTQSYNLQLS